MGLDLSFSRSFDRIYETCAEFGRHSAKHCFESFKVFSVVDCYTFPNVFITRKYFIRLD